MTPAVLEGRLLPKEKLLWSGRPAQGILFLPRDMMLVPFSLLWGGFAIFWETQALSSGKAPGFFAVFGAAFVLVGLFLIFGRFLFDAWLRGNTHYALTDQRIIIQRSAPWADFKAVDLRQVPETSLSGNSGGRGTVRFGPQAQVWAGSSRSGFAGWIPSLDPTPQFLAINDARRVFEMVEEHRREGDARGQVRAR